MIKQTHSLFLPVNDNPKRTQLMFQMAQATQTQYSKCDFQTALNIN